MSEALIIFGVLICVVSLLAVFLPARLLRLARAVTITTRLRLITFIVRTSLGAFLIAAAPSTEYALVMKIIGGLLVVSGVTVLLIGNARIQGLLSWAMRLGTSAVIVGGLVGLLFGVFLIFSGS
jgi:hypothetical protein